MSVGPPMPVPNQSAANGTHATGAMKRSPSNKGVTTSSSQRNQPIARPKGMPINAASPKPMPKRCRLESMWSTRVAPANGLWNRSMSFANTSWGIGRNCGGAKCSARARYQKAKKATAPIVVKRQNCARDSLSFMPPPGLCATAWPGPPADPGARSLLRRRYRRPPWPPESSRGRCPGKLD